MLAGRLALEWGIVDVRAWLRSLPKGALDFWEAFDAVEPIGERWAQSAMIAHQAAFGTYCNAGKTPPDFDDYMPPRWKRPKRKTEVVIPDVQANQAAFGGLLSALGLEKAKHGRNN